MLTSVQTKRIVEPGEELTFDYGDASGSVAQDDRGRDGDDTLTLMSTDIEHPANRTPCLCGASCCRGWMPYDPSL